MNVNFDTVDGSEISNYHRLDVQSHVHNGEKLPINGCRIEAANSYLNS